MRGRWRRVAVWLLAVSTSASLLSPAAATSRSNMLPTLELAGRTVIHWKGTAVVRVHSRVNASIPDHGGTRLFSKGHYAFIRLDLESACRHDVPHCAGGMIDWTPSLSDGVRAGNTDDGPGSDNVHLYGTPPQLAAGWTVFYLVSDGESTLELTTPSLTGKREVRLRRPAPIAVQRLPVRCDGAAVAACDRGTGYGSRVMFGGASHDVGRGGLAQVIVINFESSDQYYQSNGVVPNYQPTGVTGCYYAAGTANSQSPDVRDHPTGCDLVADADNTPDLGEAYWLGYTSVYAPVAGWAIWRGSPDLHGPAYLGYIIDNPVNVPQPKWREAWGLWITWLS